MAERLQKRECDSVLNPPRAWADRPTDRLGSDGNFNSDLFPYLIFASASGAKREEVPQLTRTLSS